MGNSFDDNHNDGGNGHHDFTGGFQMMGVLGALKTGDMHIDMLIAMVVPLILKFLFDRMGKVEEYLGDWWQELMDNFRQPTEEYERYITYSTTRSSWGYTYSTDEDTQNSVLMKSIKLYLVSRFLASTIRLLVSCVPFLIPTFCPSHLSTGSSCKAKVENGILGAHRN